MTFEFETSAQDQSDLPWLNPRTDETSHLDSILMRSLAGEYTDQHGNPELNAGTALRTTVSILAPTHQASAVAAGMGEKFAIGPKTTHSAFFRPKYPDYVNKTMSDAEAFYRDKDKTRAQKRAAVDKIADLLNIKYKDAFFSEFEKQNGHSEAAIIGFNFNPLSLAERWVTRNNADMPLFGIVDETSMIPPSNVIDISGQCGATVFLGDRFQLPPIGATIRKNGIQAASELEGAQTFEFRKNFRLSDNSPKVAEVLTSLRDLCCELEAGNVGVYEKRIGEIFGLLRETGGGVERKISLSDDDIEDLFLGRAMFITGENRFRVAFNHMLRRGLVGCHAQKLQPGERVFAKAPIKASKKLPHVIFLRKDPRLIFAGAYDQGGDDIIADWDSTDTFLHEYPNKKADAEAHSLLYKLDSAQNEHLKKYGASEMFQNVRGAQIEVKLGHCITAHSAQGGQSPAVYLRRDCVTSWKDIQDGKHRPLDFAQWLYTAISRTQGRLVVFNELPTKLEPGRAATNRQKMADRVNR